MMKNLLQPTAWKKFLFFFLSDIIIFYLSLFFALLFHFDLNLDIRYNPLIFPVLPFFVAVKIGSFFIFRIYKMTWRYVGLYDLLSIFAATVIGKGGTAPDLFSLPSLECHGCRSGGRAPFPQQTGK